MGWNLIFILENWIDINDGAIIWVGPNFHESINCNYLNVPKSNGFPIDFLRYVKNNYLAKVINSAETSRLESLGVCVDDLFGVMLIERGIPLAPFVVIPGRKTVIDDFQFYSYWIHLVFYYHLVEELWNKPGINTCPVKAHEFQWIFSDDRALPSSICNKNIGIKPCGSWDRKSTYEGPECIWTRTLESLLTIKTDSQGDVTSKSISHWHGSQTAKT